jgi:hypothetical protein
VVHVQDKATEETKEGGEREWREKEGRVASTPARRVGRPRKIAAAQARTHTHTHTHTLTHSLKHTHTHTHTHTYIYRLAAPPLSLSATGCIARALSLSSLYLPFAVSLSLLTHYEKKTPPREVHSSSRIQIMSKITSTPMSKVAYFES